MTNEEQVLREQIAKEIANELKGLLENTAHLGLDAVRPRPNCKLTYVEAAAEGLCNLIKGVKPEPSTTKQGWFPNSVREDPWRFNPRKKPPVKVQRLNWYNQLVEVLPALMESNINDDLDWDDDGIESGIPAHLEEYIELIRNEIEYVRGEGEFAYASPEDLNILENTCNRILMEMAE